MEDVFADVDARPKRRQGVTGQTIEAQMRGTMCQITEYELDTLRDEISRLTSERDQALAQLAAVQRDMRERCSKWHDEVVAHDQSGIDYSDAVGIPISIRYELEQSVKAHEYSAREIRAIPLIPTPSPRRAQPGET